MMKFFELNVHIFDASNWEKASPIDLDTMIEAPSMSDAYAALASLQEVLDAVATTVEPVVVIQSIRRKPVPLP